MVRTPLCDRLGIEHPVVLAGMGLHGGRATPPELAAAVSNAGGLGMMGCTQLAPEDVRQFIRRARNLTDRPFGVNLLLPASMAVAPPGRDDVRAQLREQHPEHVAFAESLYARFDLPPARQEEPILSPDLVRAQVEVLFDEGVGIFAAGLGDPAWVTARAREAGMTVIGLAGNVRQAQRQVAAGVDIVVAQGHEAGGHTGRIATMPLVPQVVDAIAPIPVLAAGGIADGRGVAAALALGAQGVWCGTAFLAAEECAINPVNQAAILAGRSEDFVITRAYTGKTARDVRNQVIDIWEREGPTPLEMPLQWVLMDDFAAAAEAAGRFDLTNQPAGQIGGMVRERRPAAAIVRSLVEGADAAIARLRALAPV